MSAIEHIAGEMAEQVSHPHPPPKVYLTVWVWLFILSFGAYCVELISHSTGLSLHFKWTLLVILAMMKALLIMAYFMHLKFERLTLIYALLVPSLLFIALVAGFLPDGWSIAHFWSRP